MKIQSLKYSSRILKTENALLKLLVNKIGGKNLFPIEFDIYKLSKELKITENILTELLEKLTGKKAKYILVDNDGCLVTGSFSLISSYFIKNNKVFIDLAYEMKETANKESIFFDSHLDSILTLKNQYSLPFFIEIIKKYESDFRLSLQELRDSLNIKEGYERFFDLEKNILKDVIEDINENSFLGISYEKHKKTSGKSSSIEYLEFHLQNKTEKILKRQSEELFEMVKYRVTSVLDIYQLIYRTIKNQGFLFTKSNIEEVLKDKKRGIDDELNIAFRENIAEFLEEEKSPYSYLLLNDEKYYTTEKTLLFSVLKEIKAYGFDWRKNEFPKFIQEYYQTKLLEYEDETFKVSIDFRLKPLSKARIYSSIPIEKKEKVSYRYLSILAEKILNYPQIK